MTASQAYIIKKVLDLLYIPYKEINGMIMVKESFNVGDLQEDEGGVKYNEVKIIFKSIDMHTTLGDLFKLIDQETIDKVIKLVGRYLDNN